MHGLLRVRGFTQDDAHIFCTPEQIESEIAACVEFAESVLKTFGFAEFKVELSTWDPKDQKSYVGSPEHWDDGGRHRSRRCSTRRAFPIARFPARLRSTDRRSTSSWSTCWAGCGSSRRCSSTSTCRSASSSSTRAKTASSISPVMVHRALFGSVERFFGVLIEHYAGAFPMWLAPVQVGLVPISEKHLEYAAEREGRSSKPRGCASSSTRATRR